MATALEPTPAAPSTAPNSAPLPPADDQPQSNLWRDLLVGVATQSWLASMAFHMALMVILALTLGTYEVARRIGEAPAFEAIEDNLGEMPEIARFDVGYTPEDPSELSTESLMLTEAPSVEAQFNDDSPVFQEAGGGLATGDTAFGGLGSFDVIGSGLGPLVKGAGGVGIGQGFGEKMGSGGAGSGFGFRGSGNRDKLIGTGGTKQSERAVAAALNWIARHQNRDGSWSISHTRNCKGGFCSGPGEHTSDTAATALALLPFLAAGQTHESKGPYQKNILQGVNWLVKHQKPTGDLVTGGSQMYSHGLATIALCEAYGMTNDSRIGYAAQSAINFIESGQNAEGGWRYRHGSDDSDTSVFGWQVMALKSGQMAGLKVNPAVLQACKKYLTAAARGKYGAEFAYTPSGGPKRSMAGVGLLTAQYLGAKRDDSVIVGGIELLMQDRNRPSMSERDTYYWYYATQVMHNVPGKEWDEWNRQMRRILIETQDKTGCAAGSWDPHKPEPDAWGNQGGRLMVTCLSALTLEVYYRYLPLYQLDKVDKELATVK